MEVLFQIIAWIVAWTVLKPLAGLIEGMVGLLWPADDPEIRRLQRSIQRTMLVGLVCLAVGSSVAYVIESVDVFALSLGICAICSVIAGRSGRRVEERWRSRKKQASLAAVTDRTTA